MIPMDDRDGFIWFDGKMVPWREAKIHVLTHGLHYASAVFEGMRAYGGKVFKLTQHSERLATRRGCWAFRCRSRPPSSTRRARRVLAANGHVDAYVRPIAWRGSEQMGVSAQQTKIHVAIAIWEWPTYFSPELLEKGIKLAFSKWRRPAPETAPTASKAAGLYMICTLSKHAAEAEGWQDALMLDYRGQLAEATGANLFLIKDGVIHTPKPDCFLNGITRQTVIGLARARGIKVVERAMFPEELANADEIFITGSAAEVTAVGQIGEHHYTVGPITRSCATITRRWSASRPRPRRRRPGHAFQFFATNRSITASSTSAAWRRGQQARVVEGGCRSARPAPPWPCRAAQRGDCRPCSCRPGPARRSSGRSRRCARLRVAQ